VALADEDDLAPVQPPSTRRSRIDCWSILLANIFVTVTGSEVSAAKAKEPPDS